jgi:hypothetical protein
MSRNYALENELASAELEAAKKIAADKYDLPSQVVLFRKIDKNGRVSVGFKNFESGDQFRLIPRKDVEQIGINIDLLPEYTEFSSKHQTLIGAVRDHIRLSREPCKEMLYTAKVDFLRGFYAKRRDIYDSYISSEQWSEKRDLCFSYHGEVCADCKSEKATDIHHRHYDTLGDECHINDIVPLCSRCHEVRHQYNSLMDKPACN